MTFTERLSEHAGLVEARLVELLETRSPAPVRLQEAMRHAVLGGGKRFRPFLVIESAALFGVPAERALDAAVAVELIHCYSLVHDDLPDMDNDRLRRGRPTVWAEFDNWTAILVGDALQALAFELLAQPSTHQNAHIRIALVAGLAAASGAAGMVGGQALDLEAEKLGNPARPTLGNVQTLHAMKTGALIRFSCEAGAILGNASPDGRAALHDYGERLGLAFQIADDLLDAEGDAAEMGKAVGKDAGAGKATFVSLMGIEAARQELARAEAAALLALEHFGAEAFVLRAAAEFVARRRN